MIVLFCSILPHSILCRLTQEEIEEHGLVLAIQAAHLHSIGSKESPLVRTRTPYHSLLYFILSNCLNFHRMQLVSLTIYIEDLHQNYRLLFLLILIFLPFLINYLLPSIWKVFTGVHIPQSSQSSYSVKRCA